MAKVITITNRYTGAVIWSGEAGSMREALASALEAGARSEFGRDDADQVDGG